MRAPQFLMKSIRFLFCSIKNPYKILGIRSDASEEDIKKAFRQIAQKYHPDKNPDPKAQQKFVSAKQAYQTLTDIDKRRQFDNENNYQNRSYGFDKNPFDQFSEDIFKDKSRVYHQTYSTGSVRRKKGEDINKEIKISFENSIKGVKQVLKFQRRATCQVCNGNRCKPGTAPTRCLACGGSGSTIYRQSSIVMHLQCSRCSGIGLIIKNPCSGCNATGINLSDVEEQFQIPQGIQNGQTLTFRGKGNQSQHGPSGDLHLKVHIEKHTKFRRVAHNVQATEWITVSQAALGIKKQISTIWGKKTIVINEGAQDGKKIVIKGEGVKRGFEEGDHICLIRIKIPTKLTAEQRQIFSKLAKTEDVIVPEEEEEEESSYRKFKNIFK